MINKVNIRNTVAKLLATENITIEYDNVSTASFDVTNRILRLPLWEDRTEDVFSMLVGHEVGHALFTEKLSLSDAANKHKCSPQVLNCTEDVRIERKIKDKYPGIIPTFRRAYEELFHKHKFFGYDTVEEVKELGLIDRLNVAWKMGSDKFLLPEDHVFYRRGLNLETFDEAGKLAHDICQQQAEDEKKEESSSNKDKSEKDETPPSDKSSDSSSDDDGPEESDDSGESEGSNSTEDGSQEEDEDGKKSAKTPPTLKEVQSVTSKTQTNLDEGLKDSVDASAKRAPVLKFWEEEIDHLVVPPSDLIRLNKSQHSTGMETIRKANKNFVNGCVNEFNRRKSAAKQKRTHRSVRGDINQKSLFRYRFSDDIFLSKEIHHDEENHGILFFLDLSSSMSLQIKDCVIGLINLTDFCRNVGIKFEVYGFTDGYCSSYYRKHTVRPKSSKTYYDLDNYRIYNLTSSSLSKKDYEASIRMLQCVVDDTHKTMISLGCTPLLETLAFTHRLTKKFIEKNKTQINSIIYLTDGSGNGFGHQPIQMDDGTVLKIGSHDDAVKDFTARVKEDFNINVINTFVQSGGTSTIQVKEDYQGWPEFTRVSASIFSETKIVAGDHSSAATLETGIVQSASKRKNAKLFIDYLIKKIA